MTGAAAAFHVFLKARQSPFAHGLSKTVTVPLFRLSVGTDSIRETAEPASVLTEGDDPSGLTCPGQTIADFVNPRGRPSRRSCRSRIPKAVPSRRNRSRPSPRPHPSRRSPPSAAPTALPSRRYSHSRTGKRIRHDGSAVSGSARPFRGAGMDEAASQVGIRRGGLEGANAPSPVRRDDSRNREPGAPSVMTDSATWSAPGDRAATHASVRRYGLVGGVVGPPGGAPGPVVPPPPPPGG